MCSFLFPLVICLTMLTGDRVTCFTCIHNMPAKEYNTLWYSVCSEISQVVDTENNFKLKINMNKSD